MRLRCLAIAAVILVASPASATVLKTRATASSYWSRLPLILGLAYEFDTDDQASVHDFPLLIEYNITEALQLRCEPNAIVVRSKDPLMRSARGLGDLELGAEYELVRELHYRRALSLEAIIKLPTASDSAIGTANEDYSLGAILSKDLIFAELDFNTVFTYVGDPMGRSKIEVLLAAHWPLKRRVVELETEIAQAIGVGSKKQSGLSALHGGATETAGTVALAEHAIDGHLKLEQGATIFQDTSWQLLVGFEYSFAGDD